MAIVKFIASGCPMNNIFPYVMNRNKTEDGILVSGIHCTPESALDEFRFVKKQIRENRRQTILPHCPIVQSGGQAHTRNRSRDRTEICRILSGLSDCRCHTLRPRSSAQSPRHELGEYGKRKEVSSDCR